MLGATLTNNASSVMKASLTIKKKSPNIQTHFLCTWLLIHYITVGDTKLKPVDEIVITCKATVKEVNNSHLLWGMFQWTSKRNKVTLTLQEKIRMGFHFVPF